MSCSVKISCGKGWSGSQRRINSLAEETTCIVAGSASCLSIAAKKGEDTTKLLKYIEDNVIGKNGTFFGPFGRRKVVYCDYTASGRSLQFLEEYIAKEVLPCLGDTRASTSICSLQSSLFRHEARDIVRHAVGAGEQDAVLFTGQGTAAALRAFLRHLDLTKSTVVFVGPFEHHANLRPWREHGVRIIRVSETREGFLDLNDLERRLVNVRAEGVTQMIGCFSAASCITGVLADDVATTLLLHQYGALSVWDYTTAAPYVQIDMNPHLPGVGETAVHKDAIIFAGHKFIGGVQSPGVLVTKRSLLKDKIGTEDMRDSHHYHRDCSAEGERHAAQVLAHVRTIPELILLGSGSQNVKRLPIFSFMVRHPRGTFLHHNFVCAVLNDVFGIQARGGCACAGRYAHDLMGIEQELAKEYQKVLVEGERNTENEESNAEGLRPGFAKLSFPYFMSEAEVAFALEALKMVATEGWKLLPQYVLNPDTGEWRHHTNSVFKERKWLSSIRYTDGKMNASERRVSGSGVLPQNYGDCLQTARNIFNRARKMAQRYPLQIDRSYNFVSERMEALRWFMLPSEAQDLLLGNSQNVKQDVPFNPMLSLNRVGHNTPTTTHDSLVNCLALANSIRRLNSDIPRTGNVPISSTSPRHRSLPALSTVRRTLLSAVEFQTSYSSASSGNEEERSTSTDRNHRENNDSAGQRSPATCPSSPMPVRFAVGEVVTPSILAAMSHPGNRPIKEQRDLMDVANAGRARCNSLGSTGGGENGAENRKVVSSSSSPIPPLPLSPQTLTSLGLSGNNRDPAKPRRHHCSCSSQTELNSLELDNGSPSHSILSLNYHNAASPPSSYSSVSDYTEKFVGGGRSSPISANGGQRSEDDLSAYVKEVTKELATEIKSEIREVISKVDDALSESNTSENTPQHHSRNISAISLLSAEDKQIRHDSFTASNIAEYLMEFSKEMASEVKSEIRCMVNAVDGLHRHSPDASASDVSSSGCGSPDRGRAVQSFTSPRLSSTRRSGPIEISGKVGELTQQESKMSSECSSDETVIYVMKPSENEQLVCNQSKTDDEEVVHDLDDDLNDDDTHERGGLEIGDTRKILPKIYSAVNSVSSQDSGINLSFHESDKSLDSVDLKRSSSAESNSANSYGRKPRASSITALSSKSNCKQQVRQTDDFSEDEECSSDLKEYRFYARSKGVDFEIAAATVDSNGLDPIEMMSYLKSLDVPYFYEEHNPESKCNSGENQPEESLDANGACSFCNRTIRAQLYSIAKRHNYNVLAIGQHLDDLTEGFLVSVFHGGKLKTMKAHYYIRRQDLRVVRPFVYVREKSLRQFAESKKLLASRETRSSDLPEKQNRSKELIIQHERTYPRLSWSLRSALRPLIDAHRLQTDLDVACGIGSNTGNSSNSSSVSSNGNGASSSNQQKRQRRLKTNSLSAGSGVQCQSQEQEENDETDEEPVL
ncbi:tRNA 2-thiocytidine biosynthesis protein TtcA [Dufourea novaeangliae]|uniref:tRNA 2-thiocytidine biosynthesis protein TtcA n=1 Tax=Dufourea novaeangliae TaxID=178035 RepID=A0A154P6I3_DUFNO|nr:tRNA 2-thiocytidine biosynthesis protein TtcA [Dufourea novaeangliae]